MEDSDEFDTDDEELDDDPPESQLDTYADDEYRGLVGLQNLGNTCYMNGALQALSNCQQLTRFVLDCPGFLNDKGLCRSYSELIKEIWNSKSSHYAVPTGIMRNIKCIYPAFRGCSQQDTQEFLRCFLEQLHDELKQPEEKNELTVSQPPKDRDAQMINGDQDDDTNHTNQSNKPNSANLIDCSEIKEDTNNCDGRSIISDTFEFRISSSVVCSNCNNISTTRETFKDLSIPIPTRDHPYYKYQLNDSRDESFSDAGKEDASQDKEVNYDTNVQKNDEVTDTQISVPSYFDSIPMARWIWDCLSSLGCWFWGPQVTLYDCLSIFFGKDPLEGDNEYSCEVCAKRNRGIRYLKIMDLPEVLCIHFKRYESYGSNKITTHVSFPCKGLDLKPFMSGDSHAQCTTYNLIACICHHGSALLNGHYTTYALNCYDDQWYEFDDQYVTNVPSSQVENSEAYILFYQKTTLDDRTDRQRVKASRLMKKSLIKPTISKYFISKQWVNKFNTFVEPGPISNQDFLCGHMKVPKSRQAIVSELCHPISESVWKYLLKLHGGGPECRDLVSCEICQ